MQLMRSASEWPPGFPERHRGPGGQPSGAEAPGEYPSRAGIQGIGLGKPRPPNALGHRELARFADWGLGDDPQGGPRWAQREVPEDRHEVLGLGDHWSDALRVGEVLERCLWDQGDLGHCSDESSAALPLRAATTVPHSRA
eukprot:3258678-Pyramimonas_sp.AAC.1